MKRNGNTIYPQSVNSDVYSDNIKEKSRKEHNNANVPQYSKHSTLLLISPIYSLSRMTTYIEYIFTFPNTYQKKKKKNLLFLIELELLIELDQNTHVKDHKLNKTYLLIKLNPKPTSMTHNRQLQNYENTLDPRKNQ